MSPSKFPPYVWIVGLGILAAVVLYAVGRQAVERVDVPGGAIVFRPPDKTHPVAFTISYEGALRETRDGRARVYLNGELAAELFVTPEQRFQTVPVRVSSQGMYSYRVEQTEIQMLSPTGGSNLEPVRFDMSGEGKVEIYPGVAFRVHGVMVLGSDANRWTSSLEPILSADERNQRLREVQEELDEIFREPPPR